MKKVNKYYGIIYKVTNNINDKIYIGQTIQSLVKRKQKHIHRALNKYNINIRFHNAIYKYGKKNFKWEIIDYCLNSNELIIKEKEYIKLYNTVKYGYNMNNGGIGICTEEMKKKYSDNRKGINHPFYGKKHSKKTKEKIALTKKGIKISKETKIKISLSTKGKKKSEIMRLKISGKNNHMYGKKRTNEVKQKISIANKGNIPWNKNKNNVYSENTIMKMSNQWKIIKPDKTSIKIYSLNRFCKNNKLNIGAMWEVSKGIRNHHKGYKCSKIDLRKSI